MRKRKRGRASVVEGVLLLVKEEVDDEGKEDEEWSEREQKAQAKYGKGNKENGPLEMMSIHAKPLFVRSEKPNQWCGNRPRFPN